MTKNYITFSILVFTSFIANAQNNYCFPEFWFSSPITTVNFNSLSNSVDPNDSGTYFDFTNLSTNVQTGNTYTLNVGVNTNGANENFVTAFIDWNKNGIFESSEFYNIGNVYNSNGQDYTIDLSITVPQYAALGNTRMRILNTEGSPSLSPCNFEYFGAAHDYNLNIITETPCTAITDSIIIQGPSSVCNSSPFDIYSNIAGNLNSSYTWLKSTDNGASWESVENQNKLFLEAHLQTVATMYKLSFTCTLTNETFSSNELTVRINPFTDCYCLPSYNVDCSDDDTILNVTLNTLDHASGCGNSEKGYTFFHEVSPTSLEKGNSYPISVTTGAGYVYENVAAFIDFNHNGQFESDEYFNIGSAVGENTATLVIPDNAHEGITRMRIVLISSGNALGVLDLSSFGCGSHEDEYGEIEDYLVEITNETLKNMLFNETNISLVPNPTKDFVTLELNTEVYVNNISIYQAQGQLVQQINVSKSTSQKQLDISNLATGVYLLKINTDKGIITKKIIKI